MMSRATIQGTILHYLDTASCLDTDSCPPIILLGHNLSCTKCRRKHETRQESPETSFPVYHTRSDRQCSSNFVHTFLLLYMWWWSGQETNLSASA